MRENLKRTGYFFMQKKRLLGVLFVAAVLITSMFALSNLYVGHAQGDSPTVTIKGPVEAINGSTWTVSGQSFEVTVTTKITGYPVIGSIVTVVAIQSSDGKLTAVSIIIVIIQGNATATATATDTGTPTGSETPTADVTPTATGDVTPTATTSATAVPFVTIIIEGPIEKVDLTVNVVVVYGIKIKIKEDDPIKLKIKIGDHIRAKGHWDRDEDNQPIIIVVVIIIVDQPAPSTIVISPGGGSNGGGGKGGKGDDDD